MDESQWEALTDAEQRVHIRDWKARWKLDRALYVSRLEGERAAAKADLAYLAEWTDLATLLADESDSWSDVESEWKRRAEKYADAVEGMKSGGCWPT